MCHGTLYNFVLSNAMCISGLARRQRHLYSCCSVRFGDDGEQSTVYMENAWPMVNKKRPLPRQQQYRAMYGGATKAVNSVRV